MPGLIPFVLNTNVGDDTSRGDVTFSHYLPTSSLAPEKKKFHARMASLDSAMRPEPKVERRRQSLQTPPALPILPYTAAEWNKAVSDVKRHYVNRKYKICSTRCCEILDNVKDKTNVEPAYLVYLHFYAATSVEILARPLSPASSYRTQLLHRARDHYARAAEYIQAADETVSRFSRPPSASPTSSEPQSPSASVSSRDSAELSSPATSVCSPEDLISRLPLPATALVKKRVAFANECTVSVAEPVMRPDSPTLGLDDFQPWCRSNSPSELILKQSVPEPLTSQVAGAGGQLENAAYHPPTPEPPVTAGASGEEGEGYDDDLSHLPQRSIHRYIALLSSLRSQVASHTASVDAQLGARFMPATTHDHPLPSPLGASTTATSPSSIGLSSEMRGLQLKARIERLRAAGWRRERFDVKRYEDLRENVLAELS